MNTERVFITYDEGGNELLVYKNNNGQYIDLLLKNRIYTSISPLIPFSTIQRLYEEAKIKKARKNMFKRSIISLYNMDRNAVLDINNVYIGKICRVSDITVQREIQPGKRIITMGGISSFIEPINKYEFSLQPIDNNVILYKYDRFFHDMMDNVSYLGFSKLDKFSEDTLNKMCVNDSSDDLKPFNYMFNTNYDRYITKKKVLETFYIKNKRKKEL